jgi:galactose mutarotase-like enzyme
MRPRPSAAGPSCHLRPGGGELTHARAWEELLDGGNRAVVLADDEIRVTLLPDRGADIHAVEDLRTGVDVLWKTPWGLHPRGGPPAPKGSPEYWLETYAGGWQLLLPSGGGPSTHRGVHHAYHGEACSLPWEATVGTAADGADQVELRVRLEDSPLLVERVVSLAPGRGEVVVAERVTNEGDEALEYTWGHHPAFGAPLVGPGTRIVTPASTILADAFLDGPANPLEPGSTHAWPVARTRDGADLDLSVIPPVSPGRSMLGYLAGFDRGSASIENDALDLTCTLWWDAEMLPFAWLWQELGATEGPPWLGQAYTIAIEPSTSFPAIGLGGVVETTRTHRELAAGESAATEVGLRLAPMGAPTIR